MAIEYLGLSNINGPLVVLEGVQDGESTKDHQHDLQAFLDALPEQCVQHGDVFLEGEAENNHLGFFGSLSYCNHIFYSSCFY